MRRALALLEVRRRRNAILHATILEYWDVFGDPRMAVPVGMVTAQQASRLKEPWSREFEAEVVAVAQALGARLYSVGGRRLLRGVRKRGQSVADAVREGRDHRAWARNRGGRAGPG